MLLATFLVLATAVGCGKAAVKPEIKSLEPESGPPGSEVVIKGGGFGSLQGMGVVFFSGKRVKVDVPGGKSFEAVLVMNLMLGGWECLKTGEPPWTGLEFKGEPILSDIEKV